MTAGLAVFALVVAGVLVGSSPATAGDDGYGGHGWLSGGAYYQELTPYDDRYRYTEQCGDLSLKVRGRWRGAFSVQNVVGSDGQAFLAKDKYSWFDKITNRETGEWFTAQGRGVFEEHAAKLGWPKQVPPESIPPEGLTGPLYWFLTSDRGTPLWVKDSNGNTYGKNEGVVVFKALFDTLGDHQPGAVWLTEERIKTVGDWPLLDVDFCTIAEDLIG